MCLQDGLLHAVGAPPRQPPPGKHQFAAQESLFVPSAVTHLRSPSSPYSFCGRNLRQGTPYHTAETSTGAYHHHSDQSHGGTHKHQHQYLHRHATAEDLYPDSGDELESFRVMREFGFGTSDEDLLELIQAGLQQRQRHLVTLQDTAPLRATSGWLSRIWAYLSAPV
jgi:hypothetical protein